MKVDIKLNNLGNNIKNILHLSYDLRDRLNQDKTTAVKNLIEQTKSIVCPTTIDLLRVPYLGEEKIEPITENHVAINSFGLPFGILLLNNLRRAYRAILKADERGFINLEKINLIHGHKLTFEGYLAYLLSTKLGVPFFVTLRQTDFFVFKYKPYLLSVYKEVLKKCNTIFYIVPYMLQTMKQYVGSEFFETYLKIKLIFLPNIIYRNISPTINYERKNFLTVLRMEKKSVKRKNIKNLFKAIYRLNRDNFFLDVIGDGNYLETVKKWAKRYKIKNQVRFIGAVAHRDIDPLYAQAQALLLPSYSESFGMVYAEALLNGTPILYSQGNGFDGMFENVGVAVDPHSVVSIKRGLADLIANSTKYHAAIAELISQRAFDIFGPENIKNIYLRTLNKMK